MQELLLYRHRPPTQHGICIQWVKVICNELCTDIAGARQCSESRGAQGAPDGLTLQDLEYGRVCVCVPVCVCLCVMGKGEASRFASCAFRAQTQTLTCLNVRASTCQGDFVNDPSGPAPHIEPDVLTDSLRLSNFQDTLPCYVTVVIMSARRSNSTSMFASEQITMQTYM